MYKYVTKMDPTMVLLNRLIKNFIGGYNLALTGNIIQNVQKFHE